MSKRLLMVLIGLVIILVIVGIVATIMIAGGNAPEKQKSGYSAVYMISGDVYFGKLSWFPWPHMSNVWLMQRTVDQQGQSQMGIVPFTNSFWGPTDEVYLNPKEMIFWANIRAGSEVAKAIANPAGFQQQQQAALQQLQQQQAQQQQQQQAAKPKSETKPAEPK